MGEFADLCIQEALDDLEAVSDFHTGNMTIQEAYERGIIDELGYEPNAYTGKSITCRCCGKKGLHWQKLKEKWRLFEENKLHGCPVNPLQKEDGDE